LLSKKIFNYYFNDVEAIRNAQALNITADADLKAEAITAAELANALQASEDAITIAENAATIDSEVAEALADAQKALEDATTELEEARLENAASLIATAQEQEALITGVQATALADYISSLQDVSAAERELVDLTGEYNELLLNKADETFTQDDVIAANVVTIAGLEEDIVDLEEEKTYLSALLADPTTAAAIATDLQDQKEALEDEETDLNAELVLANSVDLTFGDDLTDYTTAKTDVQAAEVAVQGATDGVTLAEEALAEALADLEELEVGASTKTHEEALADKSAAQVTFDEADAAYAVFADLAMDYNVAIASLTDLFADKIAAQATITNTDLNTLETVYNSKQAQYDLDPTGSTTTDPGADNTAGDPDDMSTVTYREITDATTTPFTFGTSVFFNFADLTAAGETVGAVNGTYFNVEADDTVENNEAAYTAAAEALANGQKAVADANELIATVDAEIAELQLVIDEYEALDPGTVAADLNTATVANDLAQDILDGVTGLVTLENGVANAEKALEDANQDLEEAELDLTNAELLVDADALAEYNAALDAIDTLEAQIEEIGDDIADLDARIVYNDALVVEFDVTGFDGAEYEDRIDAIEERIEEIDADVIGIETTIAQTEQDNIDLAQDVITAEDALTGDIADKLAEIEEKNAEIAGLEALVAEYLAILNSL